MDCGTVETLTCWRIGKKVLTTTHCNHFDKPCGEVVCHFKTKMAKVNFLRAKDIDENEEVVEVSKEDEVEFDDKFF